MIIVCLGCSYTAGMPNEDYYSWPEKLAHLRPKDKIYNIAIGGSSLLLSIHLLHEFQKIITPDIIIFQITHPHRFTSIDKDFDIENSLCNTIKDNYLRLDPYIRTTQKIMTVTPGDTTMRWSKVYDKIKFAKQYYRYHSNILGNLAHDIFKKQAQSISNFSFEYADIIEDAKKETIDEAGHFNKKGHDLIADWMNNELERSLH